MKQYSLPDKYFGIVHISLGAGNQPKFSLEEYKSYFISSPKNSRIDIINAVWRSKDFLLDEKVNFTIEIIKVDNSLQVVSIASQKLIGKFKLNINPLELDEIFEWYNENY